MDSNIFVSYTCLGSRQKMLIRSSSNISLPESSRLVSNYIINKQPLHDYTVYRRSPFFSLAHKLSLQISNTIFSVKCKSFTFKIDWIMNILFRIVLHLPDLSQQCSLWNEDWIQADQCFWWGNGQPQVYPSFSFFNYHQKWF